MINLNEVKVYIAPTDSFISSEFYPSKIKNELNDISSTSLILQKHAVWGLVNRAFKDFYGFEINGLAIYKNAYGKPMYSDDKVHFSFSHTKELLSVVFGNCNVGVDIEKIDLKRVNEGLKSRVLTEKENVVSKDDLFKFWTKKEAIFKLDGNNALFVPKNIESCNYSTKSFKINFANDAYYCSVAAEGDFVLDTVFY